jgi:hypothetical protein
MIGEHIVEVLCVPGRTSEEWPDFQVVTDRGCYRYAVRSFIRDRRAPAGVVQVPEASGRIISDISGDGESTLIAFTDGAGLAFELQHDPGELRSKPVLRLVAAADLGALREELEPMPVVDPTPR